MTRIGPAAGGRAPGWAAGLGEGAVGIAAVAIALVTAPMLGGVQAGWGATREERLAAMPGDEFVPNPKTSSTRAITIDAGPDRVWPWLAQIGLGRGGFYSYDALESLIGCRVRSARRILPELQQLRVGDLIRLAPSPGPCFRVELVVPPRLLALAGANSETGPAGHKGAGDLAAGWQWLLQPIDSGRRTRLVVRQRYDYPRRQRLLWQLVKPIDFAMERRMLRNIKARAETPAPSGEISMCSGIGA